MILVVFLAFVASWFLVATLIPYLRLLLLDLPNARSSHVQPTPRGGGVVFVAITSLTSLWAVLSGFNSNSEPSALLALPLLLLPLALVGLLDDYFNLPATWRFGVQFATALVVVWSSPLFFSSVALLIVLLFAVTAVINFTNFMDGLDGLVAGCMAVTIIALAIALSAPWPLWALVGSLVAFLFWNWSPAKVFMGDVGSTFLGAVFAGLVLQASSWIEAFGFLLVATPVLGDACLCVLRRLLVGQGVFQAHRLHLFQRLQQAGWSHSRVSIAYISGTGLLAVSMLFGGLPWVFCLSFAELLLGVWLDQRVAVPFAVASKS